jgi:phosphopantetheinyl transferase
MNRDGIAEPRYPGVPEAPGRGEAHVWRVTVPDADGRAAARQALRKILSVYLGEEPKALELTTGECGKPGLAEVPAPLSFNLSHSGGLALVALAAGGTEVGVDVELRRRRRDLVGLAKRWLPDADARAVAAADGGGREEAFYAAWTRFEARAKCTGAGLAGPTPGPEVVALELEIDPGYAAAVAVDLGTAPAVEAPSDPAPIFVRRFEFSA